MYSNQLKDVQQLLKRCTAITQKMYSNYSKDVQQLLKRCTSFDKIAVMNLV
jgi:uncharacterized protein YqgQ